MCSCDGDAPSVYHEKRPTASRPHTCCECNVPIERGEIYVRIGMVWEGSAATFKRCVACADLAEVVECGALEGLLDDARLALSEDPDCYTPMQLGCIGGMLFLANERRQLAWERRYPHMTAEASRRRRRAAAGLA